MGGNFPTLATSSAGSKKPTQSVSTNAWGQPQPQSKNNTNNSTSAINSSSAISKGGMERATWERGNKAPLSAEKNSSAWPTATSNNSTFNNSGASGAGAAGEEKSGNKKEKKTKIVLMSNK